MGPKLSQLLVRGLEDDTKERLRRRAARHGRSMEAEARDILRDALKPDTDIDERLGTLIAARFRSIGLKADEEITILQGSTVADPFED